MSKITMRGVLAINGYLPVEGFSNKMCVGVSSKYFTLTESKPGTVPSTSLIGAVLGVTSNSATVLKSAKNSWAMGIYGPFVAAYNASTGTLYGMTLKEDESGEYTYEELASEKLSSYAGEPPFSKNNGEAIIGAILPQAMMDEEFATKFEEIKKSFSGVSFPIDGKLVQEKIEDFALLSDNLDARFRTKGLDSTIFIDWEAGLKPLTQKVINEIKKSGPLSVWMGDASNFVVEELGLMNANNESSDSPLISKFPNMDWDKENGKNLVGSVPEVPSWFMPTNNFCSMAEHISKSQNFRNVFMYGGAGSGKSMNAKMLAAVFGIPYEFSSVYAGVEFWELLGRYQPDPSCPGKFTFVEMPALQVIRYGGVWELQEINASSRPGELIALNGLLDDNGGITLPTGERVKRHPNCIIVLTANIGYEGTRQMNQALADRCQMALNFETPSLKEMAKRGMAKTNLDPEKYENVVIEAGQIILDSAAILRDQGVDDANCGMRTFISLLESFKITGDMWTSFNVSVLDKVTTDPEIRALVVKRLKESSFVPKKFGRKI